MNKFAALVCLVMLVIDTPALGQDDSIEYPTNLQPMSSDNAADISMVGHLPALGDIVFTVPAMDRLIAINRSTTEGSFATVYSLPDLDIIASEAPVTLRSVIQVGNVESPSKGFYFSHDNQMLISMRQSKGVTLFDLNTGDIIVNEAVWASKAFDLSQHNILATSHRDFRTEEQFFCFIDITAIADAPDMERCQPFDGDANVIRFFADDQGLLVAGTDSLRMFDIRSGEVIQTFPYTVPPFYGAMEVIPGTDQGEELPSVFLSQEGYVAAINLETGEQRSYLNGEGRIAESIIPLKGGSRLLLIVRSDGGNFWTVLVLDTMTREKLLSSDIYGGDAVLVSPDSTMVVIGKVLYETDTLQPLFTFGGADYPLSFSHDRKLLLVDNSSDNQIHLYGVPE